MSLQSVHGSCFDHVGEFMAGDVMIVDPPFSSHVHSKAVSHSPGRGYRSRNFGFDCLSDSLRDYIASLAAAVLRWSVIHTDTEGLSAWKLSLEKAGAEYIRAAPWCRFSMPQMSGDRPPQGHEMLIFAYGRGKGRKHWNGPGNFTHFEQLCMRGENKHKAEKPLDLALTLVDWFSDVGELVIDPCAGSFTTGLACNLLGRNFFGTELDYEWANVGATRIQQDVDTLSPRDRERYYRWQKQKELEVADAARRKAHTAKIRKKMETLP